MDKRFNNGLYPLHSAVKTEDIEIFKLIYSLVFDKIPYTRFKGTPYDSLSGEFKEEVMKYLENQDLDSSKLFVKKRNSTSNGHTLSLPMK